MSSKKTAAYPVVCMDTRVELFAVLQLLSRADTRFSHFFRHETAYVAAAAKRFAPFARHPAVKLLAGMTRRGLEYNSANELALRLSEPPRLEALEEPLYHHLGPAGGAKGLEGFLRELRGFCADSKFMEFFAATESLRRAMILPAALQARRLDLKGRLQEYAGLPAPGRYTLILSPFAGPVDAVNAAGIDPDGVPHLRTVMGPQARQQARMRFDVRSRCGSLFRQTARLQLAAAAQAHRNGFERSASLQTPITQAWGASWFDCAQTHIAFAVAARLLRRIDANAAGQWASKYRRIGMPYLDTLISALEEFERGRDAYPSLAAFYPKLLDALAARAERPPGRHPFHGGIAEMLEQGGAEVTLILGADAGDMPLRKRLRRHLLEEARRLWPGAAVMDGRQALASDLSGRTVIAVGTPAGNLWLSRHLEQIPLRLERSRVSWSRWGRRYELRGRSLRLVSVALNPQDESRGLLLAAATETRSLLGILGLCRAPADFVIADGDHILKIGRFEKTRLPWRPH